ncbi:MAG: hypothetical protein M3N16_01715 [Actinomycetota bacterium]|nr:hypothetical protein [Actinomycetota bacterium]
MATDTTPVPRAPDRPIGGRHGRATAITVMTPVMPGLGGLLEFNFLAMKYVKPLTALLKKLKFIHFARWSLIRSFPYNGPPQEPEKVRYNYLFFQSNFNGSWDEYIDAFSYLMPIRMFGVWGTSFGFPGAKPVEPFKAYIRKNEYVANHYYSAYPEATTKMILASLELQERMRKLDQGLDGAGPERFARSWEEFLTDMQSHL